MSRIEQLVSQRDKTDAAVRKSLLAQPRRICDNPTHRALFALPPIKASERTDLVAPAMPPQRTVTGDAEIDAALWLREVISTGDTGLIAKAKEASTHLKTPLKELEKRYTSMVMQANPGNFAAALSTFNFADLDGLASGVLTRAARRREAHARFGDAIYDVTPAEKFCFEALKRVRKDRRGWGLDAEQVDKRFDKHPEQRPTTLTDCISELGYWRNLYLLRNAVGDWEGSDEVEAREDYVFRCLARIQPRDPAEAATVLSYLYDHDGMDREHTKAILMNLIGAPISYNARPEEQA